MPALAAPTLTIRVDDRSLSVAAGITVAAALVDAEVVAFRRSPTGEPRGPLCGMGTCYECRVTIDGVAHRRACLAVVTDGMAIVTASGREEASP